MVDGNHLAVILCTYAFITDVRVDLKCEVQRCRTCRQFDHVPVWCKYEYLAGEQIHLQGFHEFLRIIGILLPFQSLTQPGQVHFFLVGSDPLLVFPVSCNTVFCDLMHLICSDLDLERLAVVAHHSGMKRLIHVRFRHSDVVLEPPRDRSPHSVDKTQYCIAVLDTVNDDPHSHKVKDLIQRLMLVFHFFIDAVKVFGTTVNIVVDIDVLQGIVDPFHYIIDGIFPLALALAHLFCQIIVGFRLQEFQCDVLQLHFDGIHTKTSS